MWLDSFLKFYTAFPFKWEKKNKIAFLSVPRKNFIIAPFTVLTGKRRRISRFHSKFQPSFWSKYSTVFLPISSNQEQNNSDSYLVTVTLAVFSSFPFSLFYFPLTPPPLLNIIGLRCDCILHIRTSLNISSTLLAFLSLFGLFIHSLIFLMHFVFLPVPCHFSSPSTF